MRALVAAVLVASGVAIALAKWPARAVAVRQAHALAPSPPPTAPPWRAELRRKLRPGRVAIERTDALVLAVDDTARALRSGSSLNQALAEGAIASPPLRALVRAVDDGTPLAEAASRWARLTADPDERALAAALALVAEAGGSPARAVEGAAASARE
ncbi:MAG TPA: hypothetical protein VF855_12495, partial [Acidimicrobiales bacterium]